jgi:hypothetical protein
VEEEVEEEVVVSGEREQVGPGSMRSESSSLFFAKEAQCIAAESIEVSAASSSSFLMTCALISQGGGCGSLF